MRSMKRRVKKLEGQVGHKGFAVIIVKTGETKEEVKERHFLKNPDDRGQRYYDH